MVNYTLGEGYKKNAEFEIRPSTGEVCIASELDYETRNSYEFPIIATDRGMVTARLGPFRPQFSRTTCCWAFLRGLY